MAVLSYGFHPITKEIWVISRVRPSRRNRARFLPRTARRLNEGAGERKRSRRGEAIRAIAGGLRIVLLTTSYPERAGDPAGHFIETEANHLARQGHEVHVIAPCPRSLTAPSFRGRPAAFAARWGAREIKGSRRGSGSLSVWNAGGGSLFGLPGALARAEERPLRLLQLGEFLPMVRLRMARLGKLDRVIAHFILPSGYPLALGARCPLEIVLHGSDVRVMLALPAPLRVHIVDRLLTREARFRFVAEDLCVKLLAAVPESRRARLRASSRVELPRISVSHVARRAAPLIRASGGIHAARAEDGARLRWVVCARLVPSKRVDLAIREAARHRALLTVIGDGPLRAELEALASGFEPRARFTGQLPRGDALALIADAHKLVHLSEAEGAPTVIREARALGVPVLATPVGDVARWAVDDPGIEIFHPNAG
jgi:teichuronic acid biosynthesis glycosyltransferase TuaC